MSHRTTARVRSWSVSGLQDSATTSCWRSYSVAVCAATARLDLANRLIEHAGGLQGFTRLGVGALRHVAGIGRARAAQVLAAIELGRRTLVRDMVERPRLTSPRQMAAYLLPEYGSCAVEQFGIVMLDTKHRVIRIKLVSIGSLDSTVVHPREVFSEAAAAVGGGDHPVSQPPVRRCQSKPGRHRPHRTDGQCW